MNVKNTTDVWIFYDIFGREILENFGGWNFEWLSLYLNKDLRFYKN